jgi:hypothetical protein
MLFGLYLCCISPRFFIGEYETCCPFTISFLEMLSNSCPPISSNIKSVIISIDIPESSNNTVSIGAVFTGGGGGLTTAGDATGVGGVGETLASVIKEDVMLYVF